MIGDDIVITVVSIVADKVRIGISAPRDMPVHREEVLERIRHGDAGRRAAGGDGSC